MCLKEGNFCDDNVRSGVGRVGKEAVRQGGRGR